MKTIVGLLCGLIFGAGLAASGMTSTDKVLGFLDVAGAWQPDLAFVMASALCVSLPGYIYFTKKGKTVFNTELFLPTNKSIDWRLLLGAAVFGIGWGVYGYCPGPAIASLAYFDVKAVVFVLAMVFGMFVGRQFSLRFAKKV